MEIDELKWKIKSLIHLSEKDKLSHHVKYLELDETKLAGKASWEILKEINKTLEGSVAKTLIQKIKRTI